MRSRELALWGLPLLPWLVAAGLADWLIMRTTTRLAIFMPKPPLMVTLYQGLNWLGQLAATTAALSALMVISWLVWREWQQGQRPIALALAGLASLSLAFLFMPPGRWLALSHLLGMGLLLTWLAQGWHRRRAALERAALVIPILAWLAATIYQLAPTAWAAWGLPGPAPGAGALFNLGEGLVVGSGFALWWAYGRRASAWQWLLGALPALLFAAAYQVNASMTGTIAVWSMGLTLYLPWWLYSLSLWLVGTTTLATLWGRPARLEVGWALCLLCAAGYAPQQSSQLFLGLIGLWLLSQHRAQGEPAAGLTGPVRAPALATG